MLGCDLKTALPIVSRRGRKRRVLLLDLGPESISGRLYISRLENLAPLRSPDEVGISPRKRHILEILRMKILHRFQHREENLPLPSPAGDLPYQIEELISSSRFERFPEDGREHLRAGTLQLRIPDHGKLSRQSRLQGE